MQVTGGVTRRDVIQELITMRQLHLHLIKVGPTKRWALTSRQSTICGSPKCLLIPLRIPR